jgi:hypothetical protein
MGLKNYVPYSWGLLQPENLLATKVSHSQRYSPRVSTFQLTLVKIILKIHLFIRNRLRRIRRGGTEMKEWIERAPRGVVRLDQDRIDQISYFQWLSKVER